MPQNTSNSYDPAGPMAKVVEVNGYQYVEFMLGRTALTLTPGDACDSVSVLADAIGKLDFAELPFPESNESASPVADDRQVFYCEPSTLDGTDIAFGISANRVGVEVMSIFDGEREVQIPVAQVPTLVKALKDYLAIEQMLLGRNGGAK